MATYEKRQPPPIFRTPGLYLKYWGYTDDGRAYFMFVSENPKQQIAIILHGKDVMFEYTLLDRTTKTLLGYHGPYGDPERDQQTRIDGLEGLLADE